MRTVRSIAILVLGLGLSGWPTGQAAPMPEARQVPAWAARPGNGLDLSDRPAPRVDSAELDGEALAASLVGADGQDWLVVLEGPSVWELAAADVLGASGGSTAEGPAAALGEASSGRRLAPTLDRLAAGLVERQQAPARAIEALGGQVLSDYQVLANALLVRATPGEARRIAALDPVLGVRRVPRLKAQLDRVREHVGAARVAAELGFDGSGSLVAVLDTGIDYSHATFGGPGSRAAYAANDPDRVEPGSFPTLKVVGGVDLAGSRYAADCPLFPPPALRCSPRPSPDADPLDEVHPDGMPGQGHGTHTASIVAGLGNGTGASALAPGIAPAAALVAVKIFGAPRSTDPSYQVGETSLLLDGLEWVLAHNLGMAVPGLPAQTPEGLRRPIDVVSLSLGSDWGGGSALYDAAIRALTEAGVTVVASVGNAGGTPYIASAPAVAPEALAVAASHAPGESAPELVASWGERRLRTRAIEPDEGFAARLGDSGPIQGQLAWYGQACDAADGSPAPPVQPVEGRVALIVRGTCTFAEKLSNAAELGALAAVVYNGDGLAFAMQAGCGQVGGRCIEIPALMIDREPGLDLRVAALGPEPVSVDLSLVPIADIGDRIVEGSSRGPARQGSGLKPQISAPGASVVAAWAGTGSERRTLSGTSQAAPVVAGAAALLRQRARSQGLDLSALDLAALLIGQARPAIHAGSPELGPLVPVARQGAGLLDARAAAGSEILMRSESGIAELGFGPLHLASGAYFETRRIALRNLGSRDRQLTLGTRFLFEDDQAAGIALAYAPTELTLPAAGSASVSVTLSVDPNAVRGWTLTGPGRARLLANPDFDRFEVDGFVELTERDAAGNPVEGPPVASMPFLALPRRHSCIQVADAAIGLPRGGEARLAPRNDCVEAGGLSAYSWVATDPTEAAAPGAVDLRHVGMRDFTLPPSARDPRFPDLPLQVIEFAVETAGTRRSPLDTRFRVYFDVDRDGVWDRVGQVEAFAGPRFGSFVTEVDPGSLEPDWVALPRNPDTGAIQFFINELPYDLDERVAVLRFFANHPVYGIGIDLDAGDARFDFAIEAADALGDAPLTEAFPGFDHAPDDLTRGGRYHFAQAGFECLRLDCPDCEDPADGAARELLPLAPLGGTLGLRARMCADPPDGLPIGLLLHLASNLPADQLRAIAIRSGPSPLYLPRLLQPTGGG
ncbi:MAG: S8 family serine peptidase [Chloroflexi bacterium]|nr:S8 family serine peptidase [Chloroflexota bacterium]